MHVLMTPELTGHSRDLVPLRNLEEKRALIGLVSPLYTPDPTPSTSEWGQEHATRGKGVANGSN